MKSQRGALLNTKTNKSKPKNSTFIENKKVRNALTSLNTGMWKLKFGMRAQNESYYMLFIFIF
jgi:hypothetical protein